MRRNLIHYRADTAHILHWLGGLTYITYTQKLPHNLHVILRHTVCVIKMIRVLWFDKRLRFNCFAKKQFSI